MHMTWFPNCLTLYRVPYLVGAGPANPRSIAGEDLQAGSMDDLDDVGDCSILLGAHNSMSRLAQSDGGKFGGRPAARPLPAGTWNCPGRARLGPNLRRGDREKSTNGNVAAQNPELS